MGYHGWRIGLARIGLCAVPMGFAIAGERPAIDQGTDALRRGQPAQAVQHFTAELAAPERPIEVRARAFYLRAKAYASLKQPVLAKVDLEAALWLKKLPATDAADAERLKSQLAAANAVAAGGVTLALVTSEALAPVKMAPVKMTPVKIAPPAPDRDALAPSSQLDARREVSMPAWSPASVAPAKMVEAAPVPVPSQAPTPVAAAAPSADATGARSGDIVTGSLKPVPQSAPAPQSEIVTGSLNPVQPPNSAAPQPAPETRWRSSVAAVQPVEQSSLAPVTASLSEAPSASPPKPVTSPSPPARAVASEPAPPPASGVRAAFAASTEPTPDEPSTAPSSNLVSGIPLLGALFEKEPSPLDAEIARADELQRRHFEKLRRHNEAVRQYLAGKSSAQ